MMRARACGERELIVIQGVARDRDGFGIWVNSSNGCVQAQVDILVFIELFGAQKQALAVHFAQKIRFGKRGALVGRHGFLANQGDVAIIPKISQLCGERCASLSGADNDDVGHGVFSVLVNFADRNAGHGVRQLQSERDFMRAARGYL